MLMEKFDAKTMQLDEKSSDVLFKGTTWDIPDSNGLGKQCRTSSSYMGLEKKWPDPEETMTDGLWKVIAEYIHVVYETEGADFAAGIANAASLSNLIDYWIFTNLIMAEDNTFKTPIFLQKTDLFMSYHGIWISHSVFVGTVIPIRIMSTENHVPSHKPMISVQDDGLSSITTEPQTCCRNAGLHCVKMA